VRPEYFSPDGDGVDDKLSFDIQVDAAAGVVDWKLEVFEAAIVESSNPNAVSSERLFKDWSGKGKPPPRSPGTVNPPEANWWNPPPITASVSWPGTNWATARLCRA
jgi:hypothetical protein